MDEASLVALHSKLKSSGPVGGRGGLGAGGAAPRRVEADASAPRSALYARFVPAGSWKPSDDGVAREYAGKRMTFGDGCEGAAAAAAPALAPAPAKRARRERGASAACEADAAAAAAATAGAAAAPALLDATIDWLKACALAALREASKGALSRRKLSKRALARAREAGAPTIVSGDKAALERALPRALLSLVLDGAVDAATDGDGFALAGAVQ
jgi:hypothetical protein